jgi:ornithine decarboxylase
MAAVKAGITRFAVDCRDEIVKLAAMAPNAQVYVRLKVPNNGSGYPLTKRFGASAAEDAVNLMLFAQESGLEPIGLTFHVGSQCTNLDNWRHALRICDETWQLAVKSGIETLCLLDMGGGFPIRYHAQENAPEPHDVARAVQEELAGKFPGLTTLVLEPGRYLVAECGVLRTTVIATKNDDGENIAFLDCGLFNGLMESRDWGIGEPGQFWFPIELVTADDDIRQDQVVTLLGPSCDSVDVIVRGLPLKELRMGDVLTFRLSGAYTNSYESYNGLKYPTVTQAAAADESGLRLVRTANG